MRIKCIEEFNDVCFTISEFDRKYVPVFEMCFYEKTDHSYFKRFPKDTKYLPKIQENFIKFGEEMFSQLGYFIDIPWEKALLEFTQRVQGKNIRWWLTGSCASCIRGIPLHPHDVDIMIDSSDIGLLESIFFDDIIEPIRDTNGWLTKDFGVLFLGARVDIASDPVDALDSPKPVDCGPYAREHLETVLWNGYEIKVPPLELQRYVNELRGRQDRARMIQQHIQKTTTSL